MNAIFAKWTTRTDYKAYMASSRLFAVRLHSRRASASHAMVDIVRSCGYNGTGDSVPLVRRTQ